MELFAWSSWLLFLFPSPTLVSDQEDSKAVLLVDPRLRHFLSAHQHRSHYLRSQTQKTSQLPPPNPVLARTGELSGMQGRGIMSGGGPGLTLASSKPCWSKSQCLQPPIHTAHNCQLKPMPFLPSLFSVLEWVSFTLQDLQRVNELYSCC